jgi:hypothetical protein
MAIANRKFNLENPLCIIYGKDVKKPKRIVKANLKNIFKRRSF